MGCTCFKGVVLGGWVWCFAHFKACSNLPFFYLLFIIHLWQMHLLRCERKYSLSCWVENRDPAVGRSLIEKRCWMWSIGTSLNATKKNLKDIIISEIPSKDGRIISIQHPWESSIFEIFEVATSSNLPRKLRRGAACHILQGKSIPQKINQTKNTAFTVFWQTAQKSFSSTRRLHGSILPCMPSWQFRAIHHEFPSRPQCWIIRIKAFISIHAL